MIRGNREHFLRRRRYDYKNLIAHHTKIRLIFEAVSNILARCLGDDHAGCFNCRQGRVVRRTHELGGTRRRRQALCAGKWKRIRHSDSTIDADENIRGCTGCNRPNALNGRLSGLTLSSSTSNITMAPSVLHLIKMHASWICAFSGKCPGGFPLWRSSDIVWPCFGPGTDGFSQ